MPRSDLYIQENQAPVTEAVKGISIRSDVMFTNLRGEAKNGTKKRQTKAIEKLQPALQRMLLPGESVFLVLRCMSPLSPLEQLTASWWTGMLAATAMVATNQRILVFPVKRDGSWRESTREVKWGDLGEAKPTGWLSPSFSLRYKSGKKETYTRCRRDGAKKLGAIAATMIPAGAGEISAGQGPVPLCPDCRGSLTPGVYRCPACGLVFKNEKSMILRSIFLPGGGYFYTGHPLVAILPALVEIYLIFDILLLVLTGSYRKPEEQGALAALLIFLVIVWGLETAVTVLHCRRYVREFIPEKRDPGRAPLCDSRVHGNV